MKSSLDNRSGRVYVDTDSVLARYAEWHSRIKSRPVAAFGPESKNAMLFVEDEIILDPSDRELISELISRYGAQIIEADPLPVAPFQLHKERHKEFVDMPHPIRLRVAAQRLDYRDEVLERAAEQMFKNQGGVTITSETGATVAAIVARHALDGRPIGLNLFGEKLAMPLSTITEGPLPPTDAGKPAVGSNPAAWQAFAGKTRIIDAWQLVDSIRQVRGNRFTTVCILDQGFWLDNKGIPMVSPSQAASDFGGSFIQLNLENEGASAGGSDGDGDWHGNGVASTAAAAVANNLGAAGSGGTVATPVFFRSDLSVDKTLRGVRICAAWGIDVLNMSFGIKAGWELFFPTTAWNNAFQFAFDNDVVMIAAAGNDGEDLPDDSNIRPATRTPGVLTVGALDTNDNARGDSNYGSSVGIWAPGTDIPVAPDPGPFHQNGSFWSQTSFASPLVAGVAAMMKFANDRLSAADIIRILVETGWKGNGRVAKGLDAFAAVYAAINKTLPDTDEPNNTPGTARELILSSTAGKLVPTFNGFTSRSSFTDPDYWKFRVEKFSSVTVTVEWYERLGSMFVALESPDPDAYGVEDMISSGGSQSGKISVKGFLSPGIYSIRVGGQGATAYKLAVSRVAVPLKPDYFESNDSFDHCPTFHFIFNKWLYAFGLTTFGPGTYDATLHQERGISATLDGSAKLVMDDDYFRLLVPDTLYVFTRPTVSVFNTDVPVSVTLYNQARQVIQQWTGVRHVTFYPPVKSTCFFTVTASAPTRYKISIRMAADPTKIPGPLQEELQLLPKWWGNPSPVEIESKISHFLVDLNTDRGDGNMLAFREPAERVELQLLTLKGEAIRTGETAEGKLFIDTRGIEPGTYVVRVSRAEDAVLRFVELKSVAPLRQ